MPQVSVTINGKNYRMACDEGQESHLVSLAEKLDSYVGQLKGSFGEIGDQRLTVMAGIMVTDELVELQAKVGKLESEIEKLKENSDSVVGELSSVEDETARQISDLADRLSKIVSKMSGETVSVK